MEREKLFDPRLADQSRIDRPVLTNVVEGRPSWRDVYPQWWAGATIASPHIPAALEAHKTLRKLRSLVERLRNGNDEAAYELNEEYLHQTDACRLALLRVLQIEKADVILEANGTAAIALARNMIDVSDGEEIITTDGGGNVVLPVLMGRDPWNYPSMFKENVGLFTEHKANLVDNDTPKVRTRQIKMLREDGDRKTNTQIISELKRALLDRPIRIVMIPQVTKTGRFLPVREIGEIIKSFNKSSGRQITYIVDAVQALGRTDASSTYQPLEYADFYVVNSSKALGGILAASGIVVRQETVERCLPNLLASTYSRHLRFFQFSEDYREIKDLLEQRNDHQAISLPEVTSFRHVLEDFYQRGEGKTFMDRRIFQLKRVQEIREKIIDNLRSIEGIRVYDEEDDIPVVPSIVTFTFNNGVRAREVKKALQDPRLGPIVTLSSNVGHLMRLEIPEYRPVPSIEVLIEKLRMVINLLSL